jgi:hypothetical protein
MGTAAKLQEPKWLSSTRAAAQTLQSLAPKGLRHREEKTLKNFDLNNMIPKIK